MSIKHLFRSAEQRQLSDGPAPRYCYLWTLTFPDAETRGDPRLAMRRWDSFRKWLDKTGKCGVRALERGEGGAFHFHIATPQWWEACELWAVGERYGFGRVDARRRPVEAAYYLAKYVGKGAGRAWLPKGMRQWACFGFRGCAANAIVKRERVRVVVANVSEKLYTVLRWWVGDVVAFSHRYRPADGQPDVFKNMELKDAQVKYVVNALTAGAICAVGEFRGCQVRVQSMEDPATKQKVERVLVECAVELAGMPHTVTEWTKHGTKVDDVKPPQVQRGEAVLVMIESVRWYRGARALSGMVRSLVSLV